MSESRVDLVFDGRCGFCTRSVDWLRRLDRAGRVRFHPYQQAGVLTRFGLTEDEAGSAAWAFAGGRRAGGAGAVNLALDAALGTTLFSAVYHLPGIRWVQDRAYRWVAGHRHLLPGTTPWCRRYPDECGSPHRR